LEHSKQSTKEEETVRKKETALSPQDFCHGNTVLPGVSGGRIQLDRKETDDGASSVFEVSGSALESDLMDESKI
jgi:hypothetical protein